MYKNTKNNAHENRVTNDKSNKKKDRYLVINNLHISIIVICFFFREYPPVSEFIENLR